MNKASLKNDFPSSHIQVLADNVARSSTYSFLDGVLDRIRIGWRKVFHALRNLLLQSHAI
jgi:hypothetical protein